MFIILGIFVMACSTFSEVQDKYQELKKYQKEYKQARRKEPKENSKGEDFDYFNKESNEKDTLVTIDCPYIQSWDVNYGKPLYSCPSSEYRMYWTIVGECYCIPKADYKGVPTLKEILRNRYL